MGVLGGALLNILPGAAGVAISPLALIAVILMLMSKKQAAISGFAFLAGWIIALTTIGLLIINISVDEGISSDRPHTTVSWILLVIGLLFLAAAVITWRKQPKRGHVSKMPKWLLTINKIHWPEAFGSSVILAGLNPKNLAITICTMAIIVQSSLSKEDQYLALGVFVFIGSLCLLLVMLYFLVRGHNDKKGLLKLKNWLSKNNYTITAIVLLVLGINVTIQASRDLI
jgi:hypothetical protein